MKTSAVVVILTAVFWCGDVNAQDKSFLASAGKSNSPDSNQEGVTENQFNVSDPPTSVGTRAKTLHIVSNIQYRYASTVVTSRVANRANISKEVFFTVVLPETAFISGFLMEIDGNVYRAHVKEKEEAKKEYDAAVSSGQTAAHVVQSSRNSNRFTVSVNIESEKKVTFNLTYEELLKRELSVYNHAININPGQIVPDLSVEVYINESSKITTLEVPALKESNDINQENATQDNPLAKIERLSDTSAIIRWAPTPEEQKQLNSEGVKGQLVVRYDVDRESHPQQILVNEGYFVHFFAPSNLPTLKKHVTFVLDVSGSMFGKKIEQLREAMATILSDLRPGDFFSIIIFSTNVQVWDPENNSPPAVDYYYNGETIPNITQPELSRLSVVPVTPSNIRAAKEFVGRLETYSRTERENGHESPNLAIIVLKETERENGQKSPNSSYSRRARAPAGVFSENVGEEGGGKTGGSGPLRTNIYGALLKALDVVRLGLNLTSSNDVLYESPEPMIIFLTDGQPNQEESDPIVITDTVTASNKNASASIFCLAFGDDVEEGSVSKTHFNTLFLGSEFVVAGKLKSTELTGGLTARSPNGTTSLPFGPDIIIEICLPPTGEPTEEHNVTNASFMERLWAYLTIQQLLEKDKVDSPPEVNTTSPNKKRALELALKYSFVTPLTSLVVVKPNETTSADTEKGDTTSPDFGGVLPQSISASQSFGGGYGGGAGAGYYPSTGLPAPPSFGSLGQAARPSFVSVDMIQGSFYEELPEGMSTLSPTPGARSLSNARSPAATEASPTTLPLLRSHARAPEATNTPVFRRVF
uniref:Inter-alpha-trypsin inhibitor heavy chain H4-like n=1 Tax=Timema poppense TaxID=170557 RepID=A0A7R9H3L9_TIMPO|nr:unnamed protein product [Timema poppensis]